MEISWKIDECFWLTWNPHPFKQCPWWFSTKLTDSATDSGSVNFTGSNSHDLLECESCNNAFGPSAPPSTTTPPSAPVASPCTAASPLLSTELQFYWPTTNNPPQYLHVCNSSLFGCSMSCIETTIWGNILLNAHSANGNHAADGTSFPFSK